MTWHTVHFCHCVFLFFTSAGIIQAEGGRPSHKRLYREGSFTGAKETTPTSTMNNRETLNLATFGLYFSLTSSLVPLKKNSNGNYHATSPLRGHPGSITLLVKKSTAVGSDEGLAWSSIPFPAVADQLPLRSPQTVLSPTVFPQHFASTPSLPRGHGGSIFRSDVC